VDGYPDGTFRPGLPVTRQAVMAFLHRLSGSPEGPFPFPPFSDAQPGHPFYRPIAWGAHLDLVQGYPDGTFRGGQPITRQAMVAFLHRLAGEPTGHPDPWFGDVRPGHPFYDAVAWASDLGIVEGYEDGLFRPAEPISRQAAAAMLDRYVAATT
jgi:hypothetical protein